MLSRRCIGSASAALAWCCFAATSPAVFAATDAVFIMQTPQASEAPSYDSNYGAAKRGDGGHDDTPEADARPGEYYFRQGAYAFQKKDYAFAVQMYEVAASWAYKPAEYNLGVMYARGQGVPVDLPRGMAWMALAAERNEPRYVEAREAVYAEMSKEQFEEANAIWRELKKTYGDEVALRRAKARWAEVKNNMTGTRVGSGAGNLQVGMPGPRSVDASGPKLMVPLPPGQNPPARTTVSSAAEATAGQGIDGSIAYRQLQQSANPYDPKFERPPLGRATVGAPETVKTPPAKDAADAQPEATSKHDR